MLPKNCAQIFAHANFLAMSTRLKLLSVLIRKELINWNFRGEWVTTSATFVIAFASASFATTSAIFVITHIICYHMYNICYHMYNICYHLWNICCDQKCNSCDDECNWNIFANFKAVEIKNSSSSSSAKVIPWFALRIKTRLIFPNLKAAKLRRKVSKEMLKPLK